MFEGTIKGKRIFDAIGEVKPTLDLLGWQELEYGGFVYECSAMNFKFLQQDKGRHWGLTPFGCERRSQDYALIPSCQGVFWIIGALVVGEKENPPFSDSVAAQWRGYHDAVKRCYEIFLENQAGYLKIDLQLTAEGYRFRDRYGLPRPFRKDDIRRMVSSNRVYAGYIPLGRAKDAVSRAVKGNHSPILPVELSDRVAEVQEDRHSYWARGGDRPKYVYVFRNLYCADCGVRLIGQFNHSERWYRHYDSSGRCPSRKYYIVADEIERQVWGFLGGLQSSDDVKQRIRDRALRMAEGVDSYGVRIAEQEVKRLECSLERAKELFIEGSMSKGEFVRQSEQLKRRLAEGKAQLGRIAPDVRTFQLELARMDRVIDVVREGNLSEQREALDGLIERAEEKGGKLSRVVVREWARGLLTE